MTDLTELLDRASDVAETPMPVTDDLARARAALHRQRRRRSLVAAGSVCALAVLAGTVKSTNSRALAHLRTALTPLTDDLTTRSTS